MYIPLRSLKMLFLVPGSQESHGSFPHILQSFAQSSPSQWGHPWPLYIKFTLSHSKLEFLLTMCLIFSLALIINKLYTLFFFAKPHSLQDLSSPKKDWTQFKAAKALSLNHWTARELPFLFWLLCPSARMYIPCWEEFFIFFYQFVHWQLYWNSTENIVGSQ